MVVLLFYQNQILAFQLLSDYSRKYLCADQQETKRAKFFSLGVEFEPNQGLPASTSEEKPVYTVFRSKQKKYVGISFYE